MQVYTHTTKGTRNIPVSRFLLSMRLLSSMETVTASKGPKVKDLCVADGVLQWTDEDTQTPCSISLDQLVAILPSSEAGGKVFSSTATTDDGRPGEDLTAVYLDRHAENENENEGLQLKTLPIPITLVQEPRNPELEKYVLLELPPHLRGEDVHIHVVISALSGTQGALPLFDEALNPLLQLLGLAAGSYKVHRTESAQTIIELCERIFVPHARRGARQTVILLSGDGGVVDMIKAFADVPVSSTSATKRGGDEGSTAEFPVVPPTICLIPMGTGNATANSAGLLSDSTLGMSRLIRGSPSMLPMFKVTLSPGAVYLTDEGQQKEPVSQDQTAEAHVYGAVVVSWGLHASLVADSDTVEYRKFGADRFKMAAKELMYPLDGSEPHRYRGRVSLVRRGNPELENVDVDRTEHMYVLVTPVSQLEKGFMISPAAQPLDGQLRLLHFGPLSPERAMQLMGQAYEGGKHVGEPEVGYEPVEKVRIEFQEQTERWRRVCIDGKIIEMPMDGWLEIEREERDLLQLVA